MGRGDGGLNGRDLRDKEGVGDRARPGCRGERSILHAAAVRATAGRDDAGHDLEAKARMWGRHTLTTPYRMRRAWQRPTLVEAYASLPKTQAFNAPKRLLIETKPIRPKVMPRITVAGSGTALSDDSETSVALPRIQVSSPS